MTSPRYSYGGPEPVTPSGPWRLDMTQAETNEWMHGASVPQLRSLIAWGSQVLTRLANDASDVGDAPSAIPGKIDSAMPAPQLPLDDRALRILDDIRAKRGPLVFPAKPAAQLEEREPIPAKEQGPYLRRFRQHLKLTTRQVKEATGIQRGVLDSIEHERSYPYRDARAKLFAFYCSVEQGKGMARLLDT